MNLQEASQQIYRGIIDFRRIRTFIEMESQVEQSSEIQSISDTDYLILLLVEAHSNFTVTDISDQVGSERSWTSRLVSSLAMRNYVEVQQSKGDKRSKVVAITPQGKAMLERVLELDSTYIQQSLKVLSKAEQKKLCYYIKKLADGLNVTLFLEHPQVDSMQLDLMRLSKAAKTEGNNYLETGLTFKQLELILMIASSDHLKMSDIARYFPYDQSTISRSIKKLDEEKIIIRHKSQSDGRAFDLSLAQEGKKILELFNSESALFFIPALKQFQTKEIKDVIEILKAIGGKSFCRDEETVKALYVKPLKNADFSRIKIGDFGISERYLKQKGISSSGIYKGSALKGVVVFNAKGDIQLVAGALSKSEREWAFDQISS